MNAAIQSEQLAFHGLVCDGDALMYGKRCVSCDRLFVGPSARCGSCSSIVSVVFDHADEERIAEVMTAAHGNVVPFPERSVCKVGWLRTADWTLKAAVVVAAIYLLAPIIYAFASGRVAAILGGLQ